MMNQYWEKYKNKNKPSEYTQSDDPKVSTSLLLEHISSMQRQLNTLEDRMLDLNCKVNNLNNYENQILSKTGPIAEKIDYFERALDIRSDLELRITKLEQENGLQRFENIRKDIISELSNTESRISDYFSGQIAQMNKKIKDASSIPKEPKKSCVKFDDPKSEKPEKNEFEGWQKKIEKIVMICAEKIKTMDAGKKATVRGEFEGQLEDIETSIGSFKKFKAKIAKRLDELEEFSKKICRKVIELENGEDTMRSPSNRHQKGESIIAGGQRKGKKVVIEGMSRKKSESFEGKKRTNSRSMSPGAENKTRKNMNKLDRLFKELRES